MKSLYMLRHAKALPADAFTNDFERALSEKGKKDAEDMGGFLAFKEVKLDLIITSSARRAWKTAKKVAKRIEYSKELIVSDFRLYEAGSDEIFEIARSIDDKYSAVMICGHNPCLTRFANIVLDKTWIDDIPPCGICRIDFKIQSWKDLGEKSGALAFFEYPLKKIISRF